MRKKMWKVGDYWERVGDAVHCLLCPHGCVMREGARGRCHVRMCHEGELAATGYGVVSSVHVDPVEKKPLYHYRPGSQVLSVGGWGCNLRCEWCQNWQIAESSPPYMGGKELLPAEVCALALEAGSPAVAHTYNEPLINIEYVRDCAMLCGAAGVDTILVTNGYICREPLGALLPQVQAVNLDIKSHSDGFYKKWCAGSLAPVERTARMCREAGVHLELTCLLIPEENAAVEQVQELAQWVGSELGRDVPLHLSAYFPARRMTRPPTEESAMLDALAAAKPYLDYVYLGNTRLSEGRDTHCPGCGATLIQRMGYETVITGIEQQACRGCSRPVDVVL
jgi:pyruvate formate lyase activating enzyme